MQDEDLTHGTMKQEPNCHIKTCNDISYKSKLSLGNRGKPTSASLNKPSPTAIHLPNIELPVTATVELLPKAEVQVP